MTDKTDKALEEFLDGTSSVSRGYAGLGDVQPPPALDRRILAAARKAVAHEDDTTVVRVRHWRKWSLSAALAATVVVAVPLVVRVIDLQTSEPPRVTMESRPAADLRDAPLDVDLVSPDALVEEDAGARAARQPAAPGKPPAPAQRPARDTVGNFADAPAPADEARVEPRSRPATAERKLTARDVAPAVPESAEAVLEDLRDAQTEPVKEAERAFEAARSARLQRADERAPARTASQEPAGLAASALREEVVTTGAKPPGYLDPHSFVQRIMGLYRSDQTRAARREFGEFLLMYPDAELPDNFPLQRSDAIYPQRHIIPEADDWLGGIATLAREGRLDTARQQLARFFELYPDYELPNWFPLTRADAAPIEQ